MRFREAIASALHLLVILSYFALACFVIILPSRLDWRLIAMRWLDTCPKNFYIIGAACIGIGLFFLFCFYGIGRGRFLRIAMKPHQATIDVKLLEQTISDYLKKHVPCLKGANVAVASHKHLEIAVHAEQEQSLELLQKVESELGMLLRERFGYSKAFTLLLCIQ